MAKVAKVDISNRAALRKLLIERFDQYGSAKEVADSLGVSQSRLSQLIQLANLELVRTVRIRQEEEAVSHG
jgi:DNA-directed RNA polymerase specialized sigma subunit